MRKLIVIILSFIAFLFCSCAMSVSNQEYIEIASGYLIENFGGEYTFVSLKKTSSENEAYVLFKSQNLENQEVNVRIQVTDQKIDSYTCHISSNYLSILFETEETEYYEELFKKYFTDCKVMIDNSQRFMDYSSVFWESEEIDGEWTEHKQSIEELTFEQYLNKLVVSESKAKADIIATEKNLSKYLGTEDKLKCSLVDLQHSNLLVDADFYIVDELNEDYKENYMFKAAIDVRKKEYNGYRYDYEVEKSE